MTNESIKDNRQDGDFSMDLGFMTHAKVKIFHQEYKKHWESAYTSTSKDRVIMLIFLLLEVV